jgi:predicted dehydrogenase
VTGRIYQETGMDEKRRQLSNYNVEELGTGYVRFADNLTMDIIESWAIHMNPFEGSYIVGSKGGVRLAPLSYHTTQDDVEVNMTFEDGAADSRWHSLDPAVSYYDGSQQHWIAALQGKVELLPTAKIALQTMLISQGIYLSEKLGREVTVEEIEQAAVSTALKL